MQVSDKKIILSDDVDIVLNLHDGSGFYKKKYINKEKDILNLWRFISFSQHYLGGFYYENRL